jgi:hypothetical protein
MARVAAETIRDIHFECFPHPSYSSDFAPFDYIILGPLKEVPGGKTYRPDEEDQEAMSEWLRMQPKDAFL